MDEHHGKRRLIARWPRSAAGSYELVLTSSDGVVIDRRTCTLASLKLSEDDLQSMLEELHRQLPATIAIALQRGGGLAGVDIVPPAESTLAEEIHRLKRAVLGTSSRPGLDRLLRELSQRPYSVLRAHARWSPMHRVRRIDSSRLVQACGRPGNLDERGLPILVPEILVDHSCDVYENRMLKTFVEQVERRLRSVLGSLGRQDDLALAEAGRLLRHLRAARRQASFLDEVSEPAEPPSRVTMVMVKRPEYRAALEGFIEFRRRSLVRLDEPLLEAPLNHVPYLYEHWGSLKLIAAAIDVAADLGYRVTRHELIHRRAGELWVKVLQDGRPAVQMEHGDGTRVTITPQRTFGRIDGSLGSISFPQRPDLTIEVAEATSTHLYIFDPKYKLRSDEEEPKKEDIDMMHAYRDAIRDARGSPVVRHAAILYPGRQRDFGSEIAALRARPLESDSFSFRLRSVLTAALGREEPPTG